MKPPVENAVRKVSHPTGTLVIMENNTKANHIHQENRNLDTDPILCLLSAGNITAELIWEGPESDCPWAPHSHEEGILSAA